MIRLLSGIGPWVGVALLALTLGAEPSTAQGAEGRPIDVVDLNRAGTEELERLPGIGEAKARAIVEAREARGGFRSVDELLEVRGIGEAALERLRPHVKVGRAPRGASD